MTEYAVVDPSTGHTIRTYASTTDEQLETSLDKAHNAFRTWREEPIETRAEGLRRVAALHRERREQLAQIIVREMGKPLEGALGEVDFSADIIDYYADQAEIVAQDQPVAIQGEGTAVVRRFPLGVLLGIMPWNYPYYQVARFAAPNILLGNVIILKHAPQCAESSAAIAEIFSDAGLGDMYTNIYANHQQVEKLIADPRVQGVSVTGSERAGSAVGEIAGRHLKKVVLELGGSDPFILLSTDDLDSVVESAVAARMENTGQTCNAAKRFIVQERLYEPFLEKFCGRISALRVGDPLDPETDLGPLSSARAAQALAAQVDTAVRQGATVKVGGKRNGTYYPGTVLVGVLPDTEAYSEEFFGPVAVVYQVSDEAEAIALANDTRFGLGSYVFTTDPEQADRVANKLEAGMVFVNIVQADEPSLPFGGVKKSGTSRELGLLAIEEFCNRKVIRVGA